MEERRGAVREVKREECSSSSIVIFFWLVGWGGDVIRVWRRSWFNACLLLLAAFRRKIPMTFVY